jgi:hypothetical protein
LLAWGKSHPGTTEPSVEESEALLVEIRERQAAIENSALDMLRHATRNQPSRSGANSKHMLFFFVVVIVLVGAMLVVGTILEYLPRLLGR